MKYLVLLGDGMADYPIPDLGGRTPLEAAHTPAMDALARTGLTGLFCPVPDGLPAGSDIGNLSVFGYNPRETFTGRAPLEAASQGIEMTPEQVAFRCNLVTLEDGKMRDFTSDHISSEEAAGLIGALNTEITTFPVYFAAGVSYRHLAIMTPGAEGLRDLVTLECTPPHDITGKPYEPHLPKGPGAELVLDLIEASQPILDAHPVNAARIAAGHLPATSIWLWGQGQAPAMQTYQDRFGLTGAVISAVDLVRGIGVCAGLEIILVPGATGYLDTNYEGKVSAALEALERADFVYVHIEAPDEASHEGDVKLKLRAIEDFDRRVVAPCAEYLKSHPDVRVLVAPDHITALSTRTHAGGPVPFLIAGAGVLANGADSFNEPAAKASGITIGEGYRLVERFLETPRLGADTLKTAAQ